MAHLIKFDKEIVSGVLLCATIQLFGFQFNTKLNALPLEQIQFSDSSTIVASYCHGNSKQTEGLWLNNCFFMSLTHNDFCLQRSTRKYSALVWETRLVKLFCRNTSLFEFWAYTWVTFSRISFFFQLVKISRYWTFCYLLFDITVSARRVWFYSKVKN